MISEIIKKFCKDYTNIENYDEAIADTSETWDCHHRLALYNSDGERRLVDITPKELIALCMYYNRPPEELIFIRHSEHRSLHNKLKKYFYGKHHSEESKRMISKSLRNSIKFKEAMHSLECRKKKSEANKGKHWKLIDGKRVWY